MKKQIKESISVILGIISLITSSLCMAIIIRFLMMKHASAVGLDTSAVSMTLGMLGALISATSLSLVIYQQRVSNKAQVKAADINEAEFLLKYNQTFIQDDDMVEVEQALELDMENIKELRIGIDERQRYINYLVYLEGLAPVILKGIMRFETVDDLMAYRFFLAVNNREMQRTQLLAYPEYYKGCFKLYRAWKQYRMENNEEILNEENGLDKWIHFDKYAGAGVTVRRANESDKKVQVAKLIYHTDPYIYPAAFGNEQTAVKILSELYDKPGNLFSRENIWAALDAGQIVGAAVMLCAPAAVSLSELTDGSQPVDSFRDVTEKYFDKAYPEKEKDVVLLCLSVAPEQQGKRIGRQILSAITSDPMYADRKIKLEVLADNASAIKLYTECGFVSEGETEGYSYEGKAPRILEMTRKAETEIIHGNL